MSTTKSAKKACRLLFVLRFVTFSKRGNPRTDIRSKVVELLNPSETNNEDIGDHEGPGQFSHVVTA